VVALFVLGGYKLDQKLNSDKKTFTIIGIILGVAIAFYLSIKDFFKNPAKKTKDEE